MRIAPKDSNPLHVDGAATAGDPEEFINLHLPQGWSRTGDDALPPAIAPDQLFIGPELAIGDLTDAINRQTRLLGRRLDSQEASDNEADGKEAARFGSLRLAGEPEPCSSSAIADLLDPS